MQILALWKHLLAFLYTENLSGANIADGDSIICTGPSANLVDTFRNCDYIEELNLYIEMYSTAEKYLLPEFMFDLMMRHVHEYKMQCEKCSRDVDIIDGYCVYGKTDCDKRKCWTNEMKNLQSHPCGRRRVSSMMEADRYAESCCDDCGIKLVATAGVAI